MLPFSPSEELLREPRRCLLFSPEPARSNSSSKVILLFVYHNLIVFVLRPESGDAQKDIGFIICSSGTTGPQKAICLSHELLLDECSRCRYKADTIYLGFSSIYWVSGVFGLLHPLAVNATRVVTTDAFSPDLCLEIIEKHRVTDLFLSPYPMAVTVKKLETSRRDLSSIRSAQSGGSKVPDDVVCQLKIRFPAAEVSVMYGMSEIGRIASANLGDENGSVGQLTAGVQVKISDDSGRRMGVNEAGEVRVRTPIRFLGYYGNVKATRELYDDEGFLCTGDIGHFDEDGNLHIVDRIKDLLKYRSLSVAPTQIEQFLITSPEIHLACVVGVEDHDSGELPAAVVVRKTDSKITRNDVCEMVALNFPDHKKLRGGVYFVDSLPLTPSGKVIRRELKRLANELCVRENKIIHIYLKKNLI